MTLLKKRLFSSPAAFLRTLEVHRETITRNRGPLPRPTPTVLARLFDDVATALDEEAAEDGVGEAAREAIEAAAAAEGSRPTSEELELLDGMIAWARRAAVTEDARTTRLLDWVQQNVKPGSRFDRRAGDRLHRVPRHSALPAGAARGARDRRRPGRAAGRDDEHRGTRADQEPVAGAAERLPSAGAAGDRRRVGGDLAAAPLPSARARRDPVEPEPPGAAQRPHRPPRPARAGEVLVHHCVSAGWETAPRGRWRATSTSSRAW